MEISPSSEQTQLGDLNTVGEALKGLAERVLVKAGTPHALLPRCPPGEISWAEVAQLEIAQRETSCLWWLGMLRQHPTLAGALQHPHCLTQQRQSTT